MVSNPLNVINTRNNSEQKKVHFEAYEQFTLLEQTLEYLRKKGPLNQFSIIGKVDQFYQDKKIETSKKGDLLEMYWKEIFENPTDFGCLYNPEIGHIFIVGSLTSIFLNKVDGKTLGMLSVGPQAILIGMGAKEKQTTTYINLLIQGNYLLIFRGFEDEWKACKNYLDRKSNA